MVYTDIHFRVFYKGAPVGEQAVKLTEVKNFIAKTRYELGVGLDFLPEPDTFVDIPPGESFEYRGNTFSVGSSDSDNLPQRVTSTYGVAARKSEVISYMDDTVGVLSFQDYAYVNGTYVRCI
jgi:hypothetical protein